jgi:DNA recombination protein RmuC
MDTTLLLLGLAFAGVTLAIVLIITRAQGRAQLSQDVATATAAERQRELDDKVAELNRINSELAGRMGALQQQLNERHSELTRTLAERLDSVSQRVGQGLEATGNRTDEKLAQLGERLAVIDAAQAKISGLTQEMVSLKDILANKQSRGAFGQGRMEAIIRDGMPSGAYEFQATLSNGKRPDCLIRLPGDPRGMVIDSKFPLEGFSALRDAREEVARKQAEARVRTDVGKHINDVRSKYLLPGETQNTALIFVPSESLYADLVEFFDDLVQKAHRENIIIVSPSLLMMAVQVTQTLVRDAKMREQADLVQREVRELMKDVRRLAERTAKLDQHFRLVTKDIEEIGTSSGKIAKRGEKIEAVEIETDRPAETPLLPTP